MDMEKKDFAKLENLCRFRFSEAGNCFHVCSQENFPVLFHNEDEFKTAMNIVAFAALLFPGIKLFTFEVMDNHFHFVMAGKREDVDSFIRTLALKLSTHPFLRTSRNEFKRLSFKTIDINDLENLRNVISYVNRNGAVVHPDENVFTYRWGANRFFFNREARLRYESCGRKVFSREKRKLFSSARLDSKDGVIVLDEYVSPLCFCHIADAESFFRNSRHYFHSVTRNIESAKEIAASIGESIFYSDEDLFSHVRTLCSKRYGCQSVSDLPVQAKIEMAKELHFSYNAGNKQICRLLKMDVSAVDAMFPESK